MLRENFHYHQHLATAKKLKFMVGIIKLWDPILKHKFSLFQAFQSLDRTEIKLKNYYKVQVQCELW